MNYLLITVIVAMAIILVGFGRFVCKQKTLDYMLIKLIIDLFLVVASVIYSTKVSGDILLNYVVAATALSAFINFLDTGKEIFNENNKKKEK